MAIGLGSPGGVDIILMLRVGGTDSTGPECTKLLLYRNLLEVCDVCSHRCMSSETLSRRPFTVTARSPMGPTVAHHL